MAPHIWEGEVVTQRLTHRQAGTQSRINFWKPQKRIGRGMENMIQWLMLCLYYYSLLNKPQIMLCQKPRFMLCQYYYSQLYNLSLCSVNVTTLCSITSAYALPILLLSVV